MRNKRAIVVLICALSAPLPSTAQAVEDMFSMMFRMMLTMMNVMSDVMDDDDWGGNKWGNNWGGLNSFNLGMSAWPAMSGFGSPFSSFGYSPWTGMSPWSGSPWNSGWGNPFAGGYPGGFQPGFGNAPYPLSTAGYGPGYGYPGAVPHASSSIIDGRWFGSSGEILEISGNRFRLRAGQYSLKGTITVQNDIITMYSPQTNTVTRYTFLRNQTGLLLQGAGGDVLHFTRYRPGRIGRRF